MAQAREAHNAESLVGSLAGGIHDAWDNQTLRQQADPSENAIRDAFLKDNDQRRHLAALFEAATRAWPSCDLVPDEQMQSRFHEWITGDGARQSRAKIVATALLDGAGSDAEAWSVLLNQFRKYEDGRAEHRFCDGSLPFSDKFLVEVFGEGPAQSFSRLQHHFCPVSEFVEFETTAQRLQKIIWDEAFVRCETIEKDGKIPEEDATDTWCSLTSLEELFDSHKQLLKELYIAWLVQYRNAHRKGGKGTEVDTQGGELPTMPTVFNSVAVRDPRLLATMIFALPTVSPLWDRLLKAALTSGRLCLFRDKDLGDRSGPMTFGKVKAHVDGQKANTFYQEQSRFSAVSFRNPDELENGVRWELSGPPCLPLHQKVYVDGGNFGQVWHVKMDKAYIGADLAGDGDLAMKIIEAKGKLAHQEWELARSVHKDNVSSGGLLVPLTKLETKTHIHIFMPLADCSLQDMMSANVRGRSGVGAERLAGMSLSEQNKHFEAMVPHDYEARRERLLWMRNPAGGLAKLHEGLRSHQGPPKKVLHGDVKNTNILYTHSRGQKCLQLADFGISAFKYQALSTGDTASDDISSVIGTMVLGSRCPNYPPEAEKERKVGLSADLFGFGTFFAEFVAWMSGGPRAFEDFKKSRDEACNESYVGLCFCLKDGEPKLKDSIVSWFESLVARTSNEDDRRLYEGCWDLLKHGLLVCDPRQRITAHQLWDALVFIRDGKTEHLRNLLRGNSVQETPAPEHGRAQTVANVQSDEAPEMQVQQRERTQTLATNDPAEARGARSALSPSSVQPAHQKDDTSNPSKRTATPGRSDTPSSDSSYPSTPSHIDRKFLRALSSGNGTAAAELLRPDTFVRSMDKDGNTSLHLAVGCENTAITRDLLERPDGLALCRERNNEEQTALHKCAKCDHPSAVEHGKLLVTKDPEMLHWKDTYGKTALDIATDLRSGDLKAFLLSKVKETAT